MDKKNNPDNLPNDVLLKQIREYYFAEIDKNKFPAIHKIATNFNLTWPRTERLIKKIDSDYQARKKQIECDNEIKMQRAVRSYYLSELEKGNILTIEEIVEKFSINWMRAKEYLKKIAVKTYGRHIRNQQRIRCEAREMFLSGAGKNKIYEKYQGFSKRSIDVWLTGLPKKRLENQKDERKRQIQEYYLEKIKAGSPPTDMEMIKKFHIRHWALNECLKGIKIYAPENGIYELVVNEKKITYLSYQAIADLLQYSVSTLQTILKGKIPERIFLFDQKGNKKFFYPIEKVFETHPRLKRVFELTQEFTKLNVKCRIPKEISNMEFLVLLSIVAFQEKYFRKPTRKAIDVILKYYKFFDPVSRPHHIEKIICSLKKKNCLCEEDLFFIKRGPINLVLRKGKCYNRTMNIFETRYYPRMFTSDDWSIMQEQKIKDRSDFEEKTQEEHYINMIKKLAKLNKTRS